MADRKRVLVTGGSRGIGAAIVRALHRDGADIVAHYGANAGPARLLVDELGERVHPLGADLSVPETAAQLWGQAREMLGSIDVLVNNAGAWIASPVEDEDAWRRGWEANLQLNLLAAADLCRLAIADFRSAGSGTIVNLTSRSAHRGDDADHLAYGAAKGALQSLTKGIARGFASEGILAYAVSPGWVATELASGAVDAEAAARLPLGEVTPPEDVAEVVSFLASGRAKHLTGATLDITGADYVR